MSNRFSVLLGDTGQEILVIEFDVAPAIRVGSTLDVPGMLPMEVLSVEEGVLKVWPIVTKNVM